MKKHNRVRILVFKILPCGVKDRFEVIVNKNDLSSAKQKYESIGYFVKELWESVEN